MTAPRPPIEDRALDEALDHIASLSGRLLTLQRMHSAARRGHRARQRVRCASCGQPVPCPTLRLARGLP